MSHPTVTRFITKLHGKSSAKTSKGVLRWVRENGLPLQSSKPYTPRAKWYKIALADDFIGRKASDICQSANKRKSNFRESLPDTDIVRTGEYTIEPIQYRGTYSRYSGSYFTPRYHSAVHIAKSSKKAAEVWQEGRLIRKHLAPSGYRFGWDDHGARLVRLSDGLDYHPTAEEWRSDRLSGIVRRAIAAKKQAIAETKRAEKLQKRIAKTLENPAQLRRVWVTLEDSLAAGNCGVGTRSFVGRLEQSLQSGQLGAIRADFLLSRWGDTPQVKGAVVRAVARRTL
jgi:hypothetical protein